MLIFILIDFQYSQNVLFSFEKGTDGQNHPSSGSRYPVKSFPQQKFASSPTRESPDPLALFGRPWVYSFIHKT